MRRSPSAPVRERGDLEISRDCNASMSRFFTASISTGNCGNGLNSGNTCRGEEELEGQAS